MSPKHSPRPAAIDLGNLGMSMNSATGPNVSGPSQDMVNQRKYEVEAM